MKYDIVSAVFWMIYAVLIALVPDFRDVSTRVAVGITAAPFFAFSVLYYAKARREATLAGTSFGVKVQNTDTIKYYITGAVLYVAFSVSIALVRDIPEVSTRVLVGIAAGPFLAFAVWCFAKGLKARRRDGVR